ncbi:TetR family transcriptional regulator [Luteolibacter sp. GHJ8]|jgi:AcrR family transcriptional regulator|uniref:TetR family transcriptional regulator n=1 Tax=Luteolibacter rhizosphaerae TaxID=2989719 RepID=A0ABT3G8S8_9BACT|nr:TetR/AcrR family transcriptional regulator [Luteolibacter rhizosphaerae]MCW1916252.1 TetR family transcriptional regulator [Luteolibacter rhizosphaerae]
MSAVAGDSKVATKQRLIEAAEMLFADEGFDRVSVRDITNKAGANVAAVNYHFGSREGLVAVVMARYINPVTEERLARLDALERRSAGKPLAIEEILEAFIRPFTTQVRRSELSEKLFFKLMGRMFGQQGCELPPLVESLFITMATRFQKAFARSLPGMPADEIWWRMHLMSGAMIHTMAHSDKVQRMSGGEAGNPTTEQTLSRFIRFSAAGMRQGAEEIEAGGEDKPKGPQVEFPF